MYYELKSRIIQKHGTQVAFARACGKSENWISRIICGRQKPTREDLLLIAEKLGIDKISDGQELPNEIDN